MAIKGSVGSSVIDIGTGDTIIYQFSSPVERVAVESLSVFNTSASAITLSVYISPDATSSSGDQVAEYSVPADDSVQVAELIGQGLGPTENVIATGTAAGLNSKTTVTEYTDGS